MAYKCRECGEEIATQNGRYGHFRFTDGDGHGEKGDVPDDYTDRFEEIGGDGSSDSEPEGSGEGNGSAGDSGGDSSSDGSGSSSGSPEQQEGSGGAGESDSGSRGSIRDLLDRDLLDLFRGGS